MFSTITISAQSQVRLHREAPQLSPKAQYNFTQWAWKQKCVAERVHLIFLRAVISRGLLLFKWDSKCRRIHTVPREIDKINEASYRAKYWQIILNVQLIIFLQKPNSLFRLQRLSHCFSTRHNLTKQKQ